MRHIPLYRALHSRRALAGFDRTLFFVEGEGEISQGKLHGVNCDFARLEVSYPSSRSAHLGDAARLGALGERQKRAREEDETIH